MRRSILALASALALFPPGALLAQRAVSVGIAGGVSIPQGTLRDDASIGWHGLATISLSSVMQPLGLRLDVAYNRFGFSDAARTAAGSAGNQTIGSATLNATYRLPMTDSPLSPYVIAGVGAYRTECSLGPGCDAETRYGWNAGLGTRMYVLPFRTFLEARYHRTTRGGRGVNYFPITLGLML